MMSSVLEASSSAETEVVVYSYKGIRWSADDAKNAGCLA